MFLRCLLPRSLWFSTSRSKSSIYVWHTDLTLAQGGLATIAASSALVKGACPNVTTFAVHPCVLFRAVLPCIVDWMWTESDPDSVAVNDLVN